MIEIAGPPGAGKSTLMKNILRQKKKYLSLETAYVKATYRAFREEGNLLLPKKRLPNKLYKFLINIIYPFSQTIMPKFLKSYNARFFTGFTGLSNNMIIDYNSNYPNSINELLELIKEYTDDEERITLNRNSLILQVEKQMLVDNYLNDEFILVDQGFIHFGASIFIPPNPNKELSNKKIKKYIKKIPLPDKIILKNPRSKICVTRMKRREAGFPPSYRDLKDEKMKDVIRKYKKYFEIAIQHIKNYDVKIINVDEKKEVNKMAKEVSSEIS